MIIKNIYNILQEENKEKYYRHFIPKRPEKDTGFVPFNIPNIRKEKSQKGTFAKILAFIDSVKYHRFSDGITVMPIASTNKKNISIFGSTKEVSRAIKTMIQIGLLASYDDTYQYNAYYDHLNRSKMYAYSYEAEQLFIKYCLENNINKIEITNTTKIEEVKEDLPFDTAQVLFKSKLHLLKPNNMSVEQFEAFLTICLNKNYPQLQYYQSLADEINNKYYKDDLDRQIQFRPTFTWSKGNKSVRKIGIRATNALVSAKKEIEENDTENTLYKQDVLDRFGLKYDYDVKSSVPKVTYFLNKGDWLPNEVDLYQRMAAIFFTYCPAERVKWDNEYRNIFKSFFMRGYFDVETQIASHIKYEISKKIDYKKEEWEHLDYIFSSYRKAINDVLGDLYDSEIFFHESCIYLEVTKTLLDRGLNVWQQYDCWYTDKPVEDLYKIVEEKAKMYKAKTNNETSETKNVDTIRVVKEKVLLKWEEFVHTNKVWKVLGRRPKITDYIKYTKGELSI